MKLAEHIEKFIKEDGGAAGASATGAVSGTGVGPTTNAQDIGYIPSDLGRSENELKKLSKKKRKWSVTAERTANERVLNFEEYRRFIIQETDWDLFQRRTFGQKLKEFKDFTADLTPFLNEAFDEEMASAQQELKQAVVSLLNSELIASQRHKIASFVKLADQKHLNFSEIGHCVFSEPLVEQQLSHFLNFVDQAYKDDLGSIQLLTQTILSGEPLQGLPLFSKFDNLTGTSVNGNLFGSEFIYSTLISFDARCEEKLTINNQQILRALASMPDQFKVEGDTIFPVSPKGFNINFAQVIQKVAQ